MRGVDEAAGGLVRKETEIGGIPSKRTYKHLYVPVLNHGPDHASAPSVTSRSTNVDSIVIEKGKDSCKKHHLGWRQPRYWVGCAKMRLSRSHERQSDNR